MKVLVDIPEELYDTLRNKTLNLTSDARSNGKHLVYELIGCVMNGAVIKDIQIGDNVFRADDLTIVTGMSTDDDKPVSESKTWSDNKDGFLTTGNEAFIDTDWLMDNKVASVQERNCEVCRHHVLDRRTQRYACEKWACEFEERGDKE